MLFFILILKFFKFRLFLYSVLFIMLLNIGWLNDFIVIFGKKIIEGNEFVEILGFYF